jgi:hypothetical protein
LASSGADSGPTAVSALFNPNMKAYWVNEARPNFCNVSGFHVYCREHGAKRCAEARCKRLFSKLLTVNLYLLLKNIDLNEHLSFYQA